MKQGNGTDVLGANDPRIDAIGVIYVSPNDERKSVLAAILTQEKLGSKQVVVVLPEVPIKAFQRPRDFDILKTMRRNMQTQVIFIIPSRPRLAEFVRQCRFLVYSSLENYAHTLRDELQVESAPKKSWLFGLASPRAQTDNPHAVPSENENMQHLLPEPSSPSVQNLKTPAQGRSIKLENDEKIAIYISPEEDLTSVCEQLEKLPAHYITLVIPTETQLRSHVAWKLLRARVRELGKEVSIVSNSAHVCTVARDANFRAASSLEATPTGKLPNRPGGVRIGRHRLANQRPIDKMASLPNVGDDPIDSIDDALTPPPVRQEQLSVVPVLDNHAIITTSQNDVPVLASLKAVKIFYCYAREDKPLRDELAKHLHSLIRKRYITEWFDREIQAGMDWRQEIKTQLDAADIILLLVSADFISSDYCYSVEMERALERHKIGNAHVIPIILRPADWEETPLGDLQVLPTGALPVTRWPDRDEAFLDIVRGIRKVVRQSLSLED